MLYKKVQYNIESLQNESTKFLYQQRLNNKKKKTIFWDVETEKERQNKKHIFLKWQRIIMTKYNTKWYKQK